MTKNNILISVIVPIYNAETFIEKCIESIINQTYKELEIILINDGSTDMSKKICEKFEEKDPRVKLINQRNQGQNKARWKGIKSSNGDFITFVDADDWLELDVYENLIKNYIYEEADIYIGGFIKDFKDKFISYGRMNKKIYDDNNEAIVDIFNNEILSWGLWDKLYRRDLFNNILMVNEIKSHGEDLLLNYQLFKGAKKIIYLPIKGYHYVQHENSTVHKNFSKERLSFLKACEIIKKEEKNKNIIRSLNKRYLDFIAWCLKIYVKDNSYFGKDFYKTYIKCIRKEILNISNVKEYSIKLNIKLFFWSLPENIKKLLYYFLFN